MEDNKITNFKKKRAERLARIKAERSGNDHRTLEEVEKDGNFEASDTIGKAQRFEFSDRVQAHKFQRSCLDTALERMGLPNAREMSAKRLDEFFQSQGVRIENRTYPQHELWKSGIYVYRMSVSGGPDDLAYFISKVYVKTPGAFDRDRSKKWMVMTNISPEQLRSKFFMVPSVTAGTALRD